MRQIEPPPTATHLGKLLGYEDLQGILVALYFSVVGLPLLLLGYSRGFLPGWRMPGVAGFVLSLSIMVLGGAILIAGFAFAALGRTITWFYELGVVQRTRKGVRVLHFDDVDQVGFGVWFQRMNKSSVYYIIVLRMCDGSPDFRYILMRSPRESSKPGVLSTALIREIGSRLVLMAAARIEASLECGKQIQWTKNVILEPDGLRLVTSNTLVAWQRIASATINTKNGNVEVRERGSNWPIVTLANSEVSARPGMVVVQSRAGLAISH